MASDAFTEAFPLFWPEGRPRTRWREASKFRTGFVAARAELVRQVELLVGKYGVNRFDNCGLVVSTNVALRRDGLPLAGQKQPDDPGVAVYFAYKGKRVCFACDRWKKVEENVYAIAKTIDALRGIARWGTGDMLQAAFEGFEALPSPKAWWEVLDLPRNCNAEQIREQFRELAHLRHPDKGGTAAAMAELIHARDAGLRERGVAA